MTITLNNRSETFDKELMSIAELIKIKNFTFKALVVKINGQLVRKNQYEEAVVHNGDKVDVIHLISGG
jgi:thiamine biosynthesis protein ThiS